MTKTSAEIRREKLKNRQKQAIEDKDQKGLGQKSVLDWGRFVGKKPMSYQETSGKILNLIDFLPWIVTQKWYKNLRTFSGRTTNLDPGDWDYKLELAHHTGVGENNDVFLCLRLAFGERCPICETMFEEYAKDEPNQKIIKDTKPSWRCWYNLYDYNEENNPDGVYSVWENVSYYNFEKEILNEADEGEETVLYSDIEMGKTVEIKGKEKILGKNKFIEAGNVEFKDREPYNEDVVNDTISFDALVKIPTYEEVRNAHLNLDEEGEKKESSNNETSDEKEESPAETSRRTRPGTKEKEKPVEKKTEDAPPWEDGDGCPNDEMLFGCPDSDSDFCQNCPETIFVACTAMADKVELDKKMVEDAVRDEPKKTEASSGRRRRQINK